MLQIVPYIPKSISNSVSTQDDRFNSIQCQTSTEQCVASISRRHGLGPSKVDSSCRTNCPISISRKSPSLDLRTVIERSFGGIDAQLYRINNYSFQTLKSGEN